MNNSNADFVILGGDFNTDPKDNETSYNDLKTGGLRMESGATIPDWSGKKWGLTSYQTGLVRRLYFSYQTSLVRS